MISQNILKNVPWQERALLNDRFQHFESKYHYIKWQNTAEIRKTEKSHISAAQELAALCCGYELMKVPAADVTVLEASGRYSGHVFTGRDEGYPTDCTLILGLTTSPQTRV